MSDDSSDKHLTGRLTLRLQSIIMPVLSHRTYMRLYMVHILHVRKKRRAMIDVLPTIFEVDEDQLDDRKRKHDVAFIQ